MLQKVATTGVGLENVYYQTLRRIREQRSDRSRLGMEVLMWVSHSKRPLRIDELCHALAIEMGTSDLDNENIPPQDTVLGSCLGLVTVNKETSTVKLIHYTLQEYLSLPGILPNAHKTLAESCLAYLNYDRVKELPANQISALGDMPFLEYSTLYWGSHAKIGLSDHAKSLALKLLNRFGDHISATLLCDQIQIPHRGPLSHRLFSGLHCVSYLGIDELVAALIRMKSYNINQADCMGFTPLMWASLQENQGAVELLLAQGNASPDNPGNGGRTPLHLASGQGHEGVVRQLLPWSEVGLNRQDNDGRTPLYHASSNGHEGVVRLLLSQYNVDPDKPDYRGQTPLCSASQNGHAEVVKLLLARGDVNPDKADRKGQTPLQWASSIGNEGIVRLLLPRSRVDPNKLNHDGRTPLWVAAFDGREGMVRLLLTRDDINPNLTSSDGQTPLAVASLRGHMEIVALLQGRTTAVSGID